MAEARGVTPQVPRSRLALVRTERASPSKGTEQKSSLKVVREKRAACLDGAVFAAAILENYGYPPLIIDTCRDVEDELDHVLYYFKEDGKSLTWRLYFNGECFKRNFRSEITNISM